ncbi:MAG: 16S rRNA (guanine(966)-N(2))-methyltransferase RsmD [Clostridia bacterium]|nr:16S rRNA (guanine(966)-N(2))-methyltransferase RsmD [Clostridia bacterium]
MRAMRIISGTARGRSLVAPAGEKTRPTLDFVRESLFNIIRWDVQDARVLDLFAGTGALSLEAISRGASEAVLIDMDRDACAAIKKNMESTKLGDRCRLIARDYQQAMDMLAREGKKFDVVFIDPPYRMENTGEMCAALYDKGLLSDAFMIVVEHKRGLAPLLDERFEAYDLRKYRDTEITFVRGRAKAGEEGHE